MNAALSVQAGASAPVVSREGVASVQGVSPVPATERIAPFDRSRLGADLAATLAVSEPSASVEFAEDLVELDAERMEVYGLASQLHAFAASKVPTLSRVLKDQLERASLSVVLCIAEGAGRRSRKDKARYYTYARGSATEVAACFDVLRIRKLAPVGECARGRSLAVRVVQMLSKLCSSLQPKSLEVHA